MRNERYDPLGIFEFIKWLFATERGGYVMVALTVATMAGFSCAFLIFS